MIWLLSSLRTTRLQPLLHHPRLEGDPEFTRAMVDRTFNLPLLPAVFSDCGRRSSATSLRAAR